MHNSYFFTSPLLYNYVRVTIIFLSTYFFAATKTLVVHYFADSSCKHCARACKTARSGKETPLVMNKM
jgi:hypothetical protein